MGNTNIRSQKPFIHEVSNGPPLQFHPVCHSDKIHVEGNISTRTESFCKGICFGNRPVAVGERVLVKLATVATNWSGVLRFGFAAKNPEYINAATLPRYACPDLTNIQGQYWAKALPERLAVQGAIISYSVNQNGDVSYSVDNALQGFFFSGVDVSKPLWPLFDLYGNTTVIELLADKSILTIQHPINQPKPQSLLNNQIISQQNRPHRQVISELPIRFHTIASLRSFNFHEKSGKNVNLSENGKIALRVQSEYCNAYVFSSRPIKVGEQLAVQILATDTAFSGGLTFGVTSCDPNSINDLPDDADDLLNRNEYWIVNKDVIVRPEAGDELSFFLASNGEIKFSKNGNSSTTLLHADTSVPFWMFF